MPTYPQLWFPAGGAAGDDAKSGRGAFTKRHVVIQYTPSGDSEVPAFTIANTPLDVAGLGVPAVKIEAGENSQGDALLIEKFNETGNFLTGEFGGDDIFKPVSALSGGERSRLALALLMTGDVNLLLLDEPTTHLDIPSQEVLQSVLSEFDGTILLVTHDRYLVSRLATQVWGLEGDRLRVYDGGYDEYLAERERYELELRATRTGTRRRAARHQGRRPAEGRLVRRAQQVATLEQAIADLEARLVTLSLELQAAGATRQFDKLRQLGLEYGAVESDLERRMAEWTDVADG